MSKTSEQAKNFADECKGASPETIKKFMGFLRQDVKDELMTKYQADSYDELAAKLSIG